MFAQIFRAVPMLVFPAILYAGIALTLGDDGMRQSMLTPALSFMLPSAAEFVITRGHALTLFAAVCLFVEVVKSTKPTTISMVENAFAFILFSASLMIFLLSPPFGTMEFFLIVSMMMIDFLAGAIVMIFAARRDTAFIAE